MPDPQQHIDVGMVTASTAGAIASTIANRDGGNGWWRKASEGLIGMAVGVFCGPAVAESIGAANEHTKTALHFATGAAGVALMTAFLDVIKTGGLKAWLQRFLPSPSPPA